MKKKIILNEKTLSPEEFELEKKKIEKQKGIKLIEISPGVFKTRLFS